MHGALVFARRAAALLWACVSVAVLLSGRRAHANPSQDVARARAEYDRGNYSSVPSILEPKIGAIRDDEELIEAHYLLGASYVFLKRDVEAKREFAALLIIDPDYRLDPVLEDQDVYSFFEATRGELEDELEEIRRKRIEEAAKKNRPSTETVIEREIRPQSPWINFVPFGAGQFRNGQNTKGTVLLVTETLLVGTSLTLFVAQAIQFGIPSKVSLEDADTVRTMQVWQVATGGIFFLVYGYGVIDAFANEKDHVTTRTYTRPLPVEPARSPSSLRILPYASPDGFGVAATWEFD